MIRFKGTICETWDDSLFCKRIYDDVREYNLPNEVCKYNQKRIQETGPGVTLSYIIL